MIFEWIRIERRSPTQFVTISTRLNLPTFFWSIEKPYIQLFQKNFPNLALILRQTGLKVGKYLHQAKIGYASAFPTCSKQRTPPD